MQLDLRGVFATGDQLHQVRGKFWYNYNCVDKCPDSYYVDSSNACRQCSNNPSLCQLPPLSYEVSTEVVSYDLFVVVTFNREVSLTAE